MYHENYEKALPNIELHHVRGIGMFGKVFKATDKTTGNSIAVKIVTKAQTQLVGIENEVVAGRRLQTHPNVVHFIQSVEDDLFLYIMLGYLEGQDLFTYMEHRNFKPVSERKARILFKQLVNAVHHIHSHNVAHLDLKLENVMISPNNKLTVIDFGLCDILQTKDSLTNSFVGSPDYTAPEIWLKTPYSAFKADIYSMGVILYALICAGFPFTQEDRLNYIAQKKPMKVEYPNKVSKSVQDLLSKMLENDPSQRFSLDNVKSHKWTKKANWLL